MPKNSKTALVKWPNRIVGSGIEKASSFLANERNWRIHPKFQQDSLDGILQNVGWVQQVVVNKRTSPLWEESQNVDTLVDGHLRVSLAISKGEDTEVPVLYVDLTPDEEALVLTTLDFLTGMAAIDKDKISELMHEVHSDDERIQQLIASIAEQNGIGANLDTPNEDEHLDITERFEIVIDCEDEATQSELLERFETEGLKCRALVS